jgi:transcriptional regulator with XRE-family HTH domain
MTSFWGNLAKGLRESQKISQRRLASKAGINRATLRKLERGEPGVAIEVVEIVFNMLGYELDAIVAENRPQVISRHNAIFDDPDSRSKLAMDRLLNIR